MWRAFRDRWARPPDLGPPPEPGQRIRVFGGYDMEPEWLAGRPNGHRGRVVGFIPGQNDKPALVVQLDEEIHVGGARGSVLVLEQGWVGVDWGQTSPRLHVELCDFVPEDRPFDERRRGAWAESHATYELLD